ncbi:MAG TPA: alternate F1F0 ATPase, F1 subunit alpha [Saprospiraceae bacterium]|nr:alternate F1F0 ATPase, F1 subunit alpha [Saprospiraceae bacterium]
MSDKTISRVLENTLAGLSEIRESFIPTLQLEEAGWVESVGNGIAHVKGLPGTGFEELLKFPDDLYGIAFNLEEEEIGVVLLGDYWHLRTGDPVERTGRVVEAPVGESLLGRVIDPLGNPLDDKGPVHYSKTKPIEETAPSIMDRAPVNFPLQTGIKVVDAIVPIGRGQRELILGDRQTGKTAIAIDAILNQKDQQVLCIYCSIGQRASSVAKVNADLLSRGAMDYTVMVVSEGNAPAGLNYIAPYAATAMAEYFMHQGRDVLIVYDDLTQHARSYRELSLLLRRPPGREAFPGDIFYLHSRLLERATHLSDELGGGSLTALPIVETEAQNISAYIPTNLISITDGQIYLSPTQFELGILPAIDIGKSVSRVGDKAQLPIYQTATAGLKLNHSQFVELENFARFGTRLDSRTQKVLDHGQRIREVLKQSNLAPIPVTEQILTLLALKQGLLDAIPLEQIAAAERTLATTAGQLTKSELEAIRGDQVPDDRLIAPLIQHCEAALAEFKP